MLSWATSCNTPASCPSLNERGLPSSRHADVLVQFLPLNGPKESHVWGCSGLPIFRGFSISLIIPLVKDSKDAFQEGIAQDIKVLL